MTSPNPSFYIHEVLQHLNTFIEIFFGFDLILGKAFCIFIFFNFLNSGLPVLLVFSVTPFKMDQNQNQNLSIDKVQNLGNERR